MIFNISTLPSALFDIIKQCQNLHTIRDATLLLICCGRLVSFPFVWEVIVSAMVATWNIWRGINSCLLSLIRKDLP